MLAILVLAYIFISHKIQTHGLEIITQATNRTDHFWPPLPPYISDKFVYFHTFTTDLTLTCKSSDPIIWDYQLVSPCREGPDFYGRNTFITRKRIVGDSYIVNTGKRGTYVEFETSIQIRCKKWTDDIDEHINSGKFICKSLINPSKLRSIYVSFAFPIVVPELNKTVRVANEIIIYPRFDEDVFQIPCNFSDFEEEPEPSLLKITDGIRINITERDDVLSFSPLLGFIIQNLKDNSQVGKYECLLVYKSEFTLYVPVRVEAIPDSLYSPMKTWVPKPGELFCTSTQPIEMRDEQGKLLNGVKYTTSASLQAKISSPAYNYNATANLTFGTAACYKAKTNKIIKLWKLGSVEKVYKYYSGNSGGDRFGCSGSQMQYFECYEPSDCIYRKHAWENGDLQTGGQVPKDFLEITSLTRTPKPIWARCVKEDSYSEIAVFLLDLDGKYFKYTTESDYMKMSNKLVRNNQDVSSKLVKIDQNVQHEAYKNERVQFKCTANRYLFAQPLWALRYKNGTTVLQSSSSLKENLFKNDHTQILTAYLEMASQDINAVGCYAPFYNSYDWLYATHNIVVYGRNPPTIVDSDTIDKVETALDGQTNFRLTCEAEGYPKPKITWQWDMNNEGINAEEKQVTTEGNRKISVLVVSDADSFKKENDYICSASNIFGTTTKTFRTFVLSSIHPGIIATISIFIILVVVAVIVYIWLQRRKLKRMQNMLTEKDQTQFLQGDPKSQEAENENIDSIPFPEKFQILRHTFSFHVSNVLGSGAYGIVYKGIFNPTKRDDYIQLDCGIENKIVAIKTVKKNADVQYIRSLLKEIKTMAYSGSHANIVTFIGACVQNMLQNEVYAILEFCTNGSLEGYLRKHRSELQSLDTTDLQSTDSQMTPKHLLQWSKDIACGMIHLARKNIIHGDLATRNVLLSNDLIAKVSDFGLSKQLYTYSEYKRKPDVKLPWAWLAIESLRDLEFSLQSDVWAFGVTMWEIFSLAQIPYGGLGFTFEFINMLELGLRLPKPTCSSDQLYKIMLACWNNSADERPGIESILTLLQEVQVESLGLNFGSRIYPNHVTTTSSSYSQSSYI